MRLDCRAVESVMLSRTALFNSVRMTLFVVIHSSRARLPADVRYEPISWDRAEPFVVLPISDASGAAAGTRINSMHSRIT